MSFLPRLDSDDDELVSLDGVSFVERAIEEPLPPGKDILVIAVPAAIEAPEKFLRVAANGESGFLWRSGGISIAGVGAAATISASGEDRFKELREKAAKLWPRIMVRVHGGARITPMLVGGLAFVPGVPTVEPWTAFEQDGFALAKWSYRREGKTAYLMMAATREELSRPDQRSALEREARRLLVAIARETATSMIERPEIAPSAVHHSSLGEWTTYIDEIKRAIASGAFDKIVASRRCVIDLPKRLDDTAFMARLFASYPDCTHFAINRGDATFLGATPETLFRKTGPILHTHALAGTIRVTDDLWADTSQDAIELSKSWKTQVEHSLVAQKICQDLWPLSKKLRYASTPKTRRVRHLLHLQTPINCELHDNVDVFDLVSTLHPTPAVGGFPTKEAAFWIRDNEPMERGWFTGVVGWFDAAGDGHFAVAIRCGILTRKRAYIYAGAGIVKDSVAEAEYQETAGKMGPILRALGVTI